MIDILEYLLHSIDSKHMSGEKVEGDSAHEYEDACDGYIEYDSPRRNQVTSEP